MSNSLTPVRYSNDLGVISLPDDWSLHLLSTSRTKAIDRRRLERTIEEIFVMYPIGDRMTDEFTYFHYGFVIVHEGRRGTSWMLFHFGLWVDTPEVFHVGWYQYLESPFIEILDEREPLASSYDVDFIANELSWWASCLASARAENGDISWNEARDLYLGRAPLPMLEDR